MRNAGISGAVLAASTLLAPAANAQDITYDINGRLVLAGAAVDSAGAPGSDGLVGRYDGEASAELLLSNGLRITATGRAALERDQDVRDPRGGRAGDCPAGFADCAGVRSPVSGYAGTGVTDRNGLRAALDAAFISVEGGWGEVSLGLDQGAAARFSLTPPTVLSASSAVDGSLSLTGVGGANVVNDLSGASSKIVLVSPRILGLRGAVSFAPESDVTTLDQGFHERIGAPATYDAENIIEAGVSFARTWGGGLRTNAAVTYLTAEEGSGLAVFDDISSLHAGVTLGLGALDFGAAWLQSDNGWAAGDRGYESLAVSATYTLDRWAFMLEGTASSDDLAHVSGSTLTAAGRRSLSETVDLSLGITRQERTVPLASALGRSGVEQDATGVFLELAADL